MFLEELGFLVGGIATKHLIAMGKASKAFDDIVMLAGETERELVAEPFIKIDAALLVAQMLTMHEWQIEELALFGR